MSHSSSSSSSCCCWGIPLQKTTYSYADRAPTQIALQVTISQPPDAIFDVLCTTHSWTTWFEGMTLAENVTLHRNELLSSSSNSLTVGSHRQVQIGDLHVCEQVIALDRPSQDSSNGNNNTEPWIFAFCVTACKPPCLWKRWVERVVLEPIGTTTDNDNDNDNNPVISTTRIHYKCGMEFVTTWYWQPLVWILRPIICRSIHQAWTTSLAQLDIFLSSYSNKNDSNTAQQAQ